MLFSRNMIVIRFYQKCCWESLGIITTKWKGHWILLNRSFCLFVLFLIYYLYVYFLLWEVYGKHTPKKKERRHQLFCYSKLLTPDAAAAAAESCQPCPTLCNPIDGSSPGSPVPGILQARTLEWVAMYLYHTQCFRLQIIVRNLRHNIILSINVAVCTSKIFYPISLQLKIHNNYLIS